MYPVIYDGSGKPPLESIPLRAGPLSLFYEAGRLQNIRLGDCEIVHGIYAAIRDHNWGTIPGQIQDITFNVDEASFEVTFTSVHGQGAVHFVWQGSVRGYLDGTIRFSFAGEARSSFRRNRIGFCVLHPMALAGSACEIEHVDGGVERNTFPYLIAPHQPFLNIRAITHEVMPGLRAEVRMEGDTFEMEDQRNWTDASFKTYCTSLSLPYPVTVEPNTTVWQTITLHLLGQPTAIQVSDSTPSLRFVTRVAAQLPPIGLICASHGEPLTPRQVKRLRALHLAHLRFDLDASRFDEAAFRQAVKASRMIGCPLELALHLGREVEADLRHVRALVDATQPEIARWLIYRFGELSTRRETIEATHQALDSYGVPLGAGTDAFFAQLNRERPPADPLDWVAYSINPQVHAFDNRSLVENLEAQGTTVESARQFSADARIAITPVSLKMRWNPDATELEVPPPSGVLPRRVDVRQMSLFGAVWTLGSVKSLALAGADSLTYYETTGWLGVMERESGSPLPDQFLSTAGGVYPMYHVFAAIGEFAGGEILALTSGHPLWFDGLALRKDGKLRLMVANYTAEHRAVVIAGISGRFELTSLNEISAARGVQTPEAFRLELKSIVEADTAGMSLQLLPFEVMRLDQIS